MRSYRLLAVAALALLAPAATAIAQEEPPRVAVFSEPRFPYYGVGQMPPPQAIVERLRALGLNASPVSADQLADPNRFHAREFALLVMPYGNTFPQAAFENLQNFHRTGGCLVLTGVPFTHPVAREQGVAAGWNAESGWGEHTRVVQAPHTGRNALEVSGRGKGWNIVNSKGFPVRPGSRLVFSGWMHSAAGLEEHDDLHLRFWDEKGKFLGQSNARLVRGNGWQEVKGEATAPARAVKADLSVQIRSKQRRLLLDDLAVTEGGGPNRIPNGGFEDAADRWKDLGHNGKTALPGPEGMGIGGFAGPARELFVPEVAPEDPLGLSALNLDWTQAKNPQWLDTATLPDEDIVVPLLGNRKRPVAALIAHHHPDCRGAVDVWAFRGPGGEKDMLGAGQMIVRGVVAALARKGRLSPARQKAAFATLDKLGGVPAPRSRPPVPARKGIRPAAVQ